MIDNKYLVYGYLFDNEKDAIQAKKEFNNINVIKQKITTNDADELCKIYNKLISKKIFVTTIGISFLHDMRDYLINELKISEEQLLNVRIYTSSNNKELSDKVELLEKENSKLKSNKNFLLISSLALLVMVLGMLAIAAFNKNIGYINTEEKILNKYSSWQEQLEDKEQELIQREDELNNK